MTSKIRFRGATSGFVELAAPDAAGSNTLVLPTGNGTSGQYLQTNGSGALSWATVSTSNLTRGTAASLTGTSVTFTSLPAGIRRLIISISGGSVNGDSDLGIRIGDSGGIETTGYASTASTQSSATTANSTSGFIIAVAVSATSLHSGIVTLANINSTSWVSNGILKEGTTTLRTSAGDKSLSDVLTQVRITTVNGTDTFDAGTINILYEG